MLFTKSFGYALRGILYIAARQGKEKPVQTADLASQLGVPKYFLAKILKELARKGFLSSVKGQHGGFYVEEDVLKRPLLDLLEVTDGLALFQTCVLRLRARNAGKPCPLHKHFTGIQQEVRSIMTTNNIGDFLSTEKEKLIMSLAVNSVSK